MASSAAASSRSRRVRFGVALSAAFVCGVVFASGLDLTRFGWAQAGSGSPVALTPVGRGLPEGTGSIADVAERVTPAVVAIRASRQVRQRTAAPRGGQVPPEFEDFLRQFEPNAPPREQSGEGSGFLVSDDGFILTNNHVVAGATTIEVFLSDRRRFPARLIGADSTTDVAVIKIDGKGFPTIPFGDDEETRIGEWVVAVGNPLGLDFTVTAGIISAKGRGGPQVRLPNSGGLTISDFLQTDAAINPGNSGGPLINLRGEIIGINSAIASQTGFYNGYGFAIPITLARSVMEALIRDGRIRLPVIGVQVDEIDWDDAALNGLASPAGVKVNSVTERGPAEKAGLASGDIIISAAGRPVDRVSALQRVVRGQEVGASIPVEVMRFGRKRSFTVTLEGSEVIPDLGGAAPANEPAARERAPTRMPASRLGISVEPVAADVAQRLRVPNPNAVRVMDVAAEGPARGKLVPELDFITEITYPGERRAVTSAADLRKLVEEAKPGDFIGFTVYRAFPQGPGQTRSVTLRVGSE